MNNIVLLFIFISTVALAKSNAPATAVNLIYSPEVIFNFVLAEKKQTLDPAIPFPKIYFKSQIPLKQFQDAIEKQWNLRPEVFTNAYAIENN